MRWCLTAVAVVGGVAVFAAPAAAQQVSVKAAPVPNAPDTLKPAGNYSVAGTEAGQPWRVVVVWGHLTESGFDPGGVIERVRLTVVDEKSKSWECRDTFTLPADARKKKFLTVRARIQKLHTVTLYSTVVFGYWADAGSSLSPIP